MSSIQLENAAASSNCVSNFFFRKGLATMTCVALATLAALTITLGAWGNAKMATAYSATTMIKYSAVSIGFPLIAATSQLRLFFAVFPLTRIKKPSNISSSPMAAISTTEKTPSLLSSPILEKSLQATHPIAKFAAPVAVVPVSSPPIPGKISLMPNVAIGNKVDQNALLAEIDCMKMIFQIRAPKKGTIKELHCQNNTFIQAKAPLFLIEALV